MVAGRGSPLGLPFLKGPEDSRLMGLIPLLLDGPPSRAIPAYAPRDDRLAARADVDVLDEDALLASRLQLQERKAAGLADVRLPTDRPCPWNAPACCRLSTGCRETG